MPMIEVRVMTAPEAAAYLRQQLGPLVAWDDWLSDRRRGRGEPLSAFDLQPCASLKERCRRPMYAVHDLAVFVVAVRRCHPKARPGIRPQIRTIEIDTDDHRGWKMRPPAPLSTAA